MHKKTVYPRTAEVNKHTCFVFYYQFFVWSNMAKQLDIDRLTTNDHCVQVFYHV